MMTANSSYGTIKGLVTDPAGRPIAKALVQCVLISDGFSEMVSSDENGGFQFSKLLPGEYSLSVTMSGHHFKPLHSVLLVAGQVKQLEVSSLMTDPYSA